MMMISNDLPCCEIQMHAMVFRSVSCHAAVQRMEHIPVLLSGGWPRGKFIVAPGVSKSVVRA